MAEPVFDRDARFERLWLDERSWVDVGRGWVENPEDVAAALAGNVEWQTSRLFKYDHHVEERRLGSGWRPPQPAPHPVLAEIHRHLRHRYKAPFPGFSMIQYRDGRDGQAFHRDTDMRWLEDTIIVILTFGAQRPWLLRPLSAKHRDLPGKGATHDLSPAAGDILVMGGRCQTDWEHSVPYQPTSSLAPRFSLQWRHAERKGRPFAGGSYRAPLRHAGS